MSGPSDVPESPAGEQRPAGAVTGEQRPAGAVTGEQRPAGAAAGDFVAVADLAEVDGPPHPTVEAGGRTLVLIDGPDGVTAVDAACPHLGNPLTRAPVSDGVIECPFHFYAYRLSSGRNCFPGDPEDPDLPVFETRVRDGTVQVRVP